MTDRYDAEATRRESEERFRVVVEESLQGIVILQDNRIVFANRAAADAIGIELEKLRQLPLDLGLMFLHPDDRAIAARRLTERIEGRPVPDRNRYRVLHRDGSVRWVETFVTRIPFAGKPAILVGFIDVTKQREAEERLSGSEGQLREAQRIARVGSWEWDVPSDRVTWSDELYRIYGLEPEQFHATYQSFLELVHPADRARVDQIVRAAIADHQPFDFEHRIVRPDAVERILLGRGVTICDASGRLIKMVGTGQDITEQKRLEDELRAGRELRRALTQRLLELQEAERTRIARELHDEMGQALAALKLQLQALPGLASPAQTHRRVKDALAAVDDLVERTQALSWSLRPAVLDQFGLGAALRSYAMKQAAVAGLALRLDIEETHERFPEEVESTCFRIAQEAITNSVRHSKGRSIAIELRQEESRLTLLVSDDGIGLDARSAPVTGRKGLGLVGMGERARLLGGTLEIDSRPAGGTVVRATLPLQKRA